MAGRLRTFVNGFLQRDTEIAEIKEKVTNDIKKEINSRKEKELPFSLQPGIQFPVEQFAPPDSLAQLQAYEGWVYACVKKIATNAANVQLKLFQKEKEGFKEIISHPAIDLLERANNFMTYYDLMEVITMYLELTGESFVWKERTRNGEVIGLYPWLLPNRMRVVPGTDNFIGGYIYTTTIGKEVTFDAEDILFFKFPNPQNMLRGMSPVKAAALDIGTEKLAREYNWQFFRNSARPDGVLETETKLTQDTFDRIKAQFENQHRGVENARKIAILEQGLKFNETGMKHVDMDFVNQRTFSRDTILAMYGVPKSVLGIVDDVNRANAEASKRVFLEETITPLIQKLIGVFNEQLIAVDFGDDLFFDFESLTPEDQGLRLERMKSLFQIGAISVNEIRSVEGLKAVDGGNDLYIPFNITPIATVTDEKSFTVKPDNIVKRSITDSDIIKDEIEKEVSKLFEKKSNKKITVPLKKSPKCRMRGEDMATCVTRKVSEILKENPDTEEDQAFVIARQFCSVPCSTAGKNVKFTSEQKEILWKQFDFGIRKQVPQFEKIVRSIYKEQEKEVLEKLKNRKANRSEVEDLLLDIEVERKRFKKKLLTVETIVMVDTGKLAADIFDFINATVTKPDAEKFALRSIKKFAKSNTETINKALVFTLTDGIEKGDTIIELTDRIQNVYKKIDTVAAERIARTELTRITTWANQEIYKQAGVEFKEWQVNPGACPICIPFSGKVIPINDNFADKNTEIARSDGGTFQVSYETVEAPPLHSNCRCNLLPVL